MLFVLSHQSHHVVRGGYNYWFNQKSNSLAAYCDFTTFKCALLMLANPLVWHVFFFHANVDQFHIAFSEAFKVFKSRAVLREQKKHRVLIMASILLWFNVPFRVFQVGYSLPNEWTRPPFATGNWNTLKNVFFYWNELKKVVV